MTQRPKILDKKDEDQIANSEDPDQTAPLGEVQTAPLQSNLGLYILFALRPISPKPLDSTHFHYQIILRAIRLTHRSELLDNLYHNLLLTTYLLPDTWGLPDVMYKHSPWSVKANDKRDIEKYKGLLFFV